MDKEGIEGKRELDKEGIEGKREIKGERTREGERGREGERRREITEAKSSFILNRTSTSCTFRVLFAV